MKKSTILLVVLLISCTLKEENLTVVEQLVEFPQSNSSLKAIRERVLQSETGFVEITGSGMGPVPSSNGHVVLWWVFLGLVAVSPIT